jgi:uncharacterized RDD family membrane protein YckC
MKSSALSTIPQAPSAIFCENRWDSDRRTATAPPAESAIVTWEGEPPEPYAAPEYFRGVVWRRLVAYCVIDGLIVLLLCVLAAALFTGITVVSLGTLKTVWALYAIVPLAYHTLTIGGRHSATVGMRLLGIEVRSWVGTRPSLLQALVLTLLFYVMTAATASLVLLIFFFNRRRRTLHDLLAGTLVIRRFPDPTLLDAR